MITYRAQSGMPNNVAFNTVIAAGRVPRLQGRWIGGPDTSTDARIGESLDSGSPDIVSFASIMAACIHPDVDGPERAIAYLEEANLYAQ
jgi:hypothetical protein